jgi:hypothetical protein
MARPVAALIVLPIARNGFETQAPSVDGTERTMEVVPEGMKAPAVDSAPPRLKSSVMSGMPIAIKARAITGKAC